METAALEKEGGAREERFIARREGGWKGRETELGRYRDGTRARGWYAKVGTRSSGFPVGPGESLNQLDLNR